MPTGKESVRGVQEEEQVTESQANEDVSDLSDDEDGDYDNGEAEESEEPESVKGETARETVERILKAEKDKGSGAAGDKKEGQPVAGDKPVAPAKGKPEAAGDINQPPSRLTAQQKQAFNKLPPELKTAFNDMVTGTQSTWTKAMQRMTSATKDAEHLVRAVRPYLQANPEYMRAGYDEARLVTELIGTHAALADPKTALDTYLTIGRQIGIDEDSLGSLAAGYGKSDSGHVDIESHPKFKELQEKLNSVTSRIDSEREREFSTTVTAIRTEMEAVRDQVDAAGNYIYPELHSDDFLEAAKPLVQALVRTVPNLSYGDALKRAHSVMTGRTPAQANQTRLPAGSVNNRTSTAAVSVRGRISAPTVSGGDLEPPPEALKSPRDTATWAYNQLRRGK